MRLQSVTSPPTEAVVRPLPTGKPHLDFLDSIRALAALYVAAGHVYRLLPLSSRTGKLASCLSLGHFAVSVFIVLSGYCLMLPVVRGDGTLRGGVGTFLKRRA